MDKLDERILTGLANGETTETAARELGVSDRTVRRRMRRLQDESGANTPTQLVAWAVDMDALVVCVPRRAREVL